MTTDPNADRKAYLKAEIAQEVTRLSQDALAVEKAKATLESTIARYARLSAEMKGLETLDAREDAYWAAQDAK